MYIQKSRKQGKRKHYLLLIGICKPSLRGEFIRRGVAESKTKLIHNKILSIKTTKKTTTITTFFNIDKLNKLVYNCFKEDYRKR